MNRSGLAWLFLIVSGCAGRLADPERFAQSSCDAPAEILVPVCGGCHTPSSVLDLVSPDLESRLVGVAARGGPGLLVDPANPDASVLFTKVTSTPPFGRQMPLGASLAPADQGCVQSWVVSVATAPP